MHCQLFRAASVPTKLDCFWFECLMHKAEVPVGPRSCIMGHPIVWEVKELKDLGAGNVVFHLDIKSGTWKEFVKKVFDDDLFELVFCSTIV